MKSLTGAGAYFSASHFDSVRQELHGHTYEVVAWWPSSDERDVIDLQKALQAVLLAFDHKTLPSYLTRAESIATAIAAQLPGCVEIDISRPIERMFVRCPV